MPTRRIVEVVIVVNVLMEAPMGMVRLWTHRTLGTARPGSFKFGVAEVLAVIT